MARTDERTGSLSKRAFAEAVAEHMGVALDIANEAVDNVFEVCAQKVAQGEAISIANFGTFERVTRPSRLARNPQTGDRMSVPERKTVRFVVSPRLSEFANSAQPELMTIKKKPKGPPKK